MKGTASMRPLGLAISCVFLSLLLLRPLAYSVGPWDLLGFWAFLLLYVALPGILLARAMGVLDDDLPMLLGSGLTLGLCLEAGAFVLFRAIHLPMAFYAYPLLLLILARRRPSGGTQAKTGPQASHLMVLAMLAFFAQEQHLLFSPARLGEPLPMDMLFHAGNAAELRNHWPMEDPRVGGAPLAYHFFAYCLHAGAAAFTNRAVAPFLMVLVPGPLVALFALQIYNAGRVLMGSALAGVAAVALVLFHIDIGAEFIPALGGFRSYLASGIYGSITTLPGFLYLVTLAAVLHRYLAHETGRPRSHLAALGLLSFAASGTKGSVMPMVIVGLLGLLALRFWTEHRLDRRGAAALLVAGGAATPMTAYLSTGGESFSAMFRFVPGAVPGGSGFLRNACQVLSGSPAPMDHAPCAHVDGGVLLMLTGVWALGYLGPGGWAGLAWLWQHRKGLRQTDAWVIGMSLGGAALAYLLAATTGLSQLFFAYNGQILLGVLGGGFFANAVARHGRGRIVAFVVCGFCALPVLTKMVRGVADGLERDVVEARIHPSVLEAQYSEALTFLRERTPADSMVMGRPGSLLVSAFAERRSYYETGYFTARAHRLRGEGVDEAFPERLATLWALWRRANGQAGPQVPLPSGAPVLFLFDALEPRHSPGWLAPLVHRVPQGADGLPLNGVLLFGNSAAAIYRLDRHLAFPPSAP
jgi:hypothetical protein